MEGACVADPALASWNARLSSMDVPSIIAGQVQTEPVSASLMSPALRFSQGRVH